MAVDKTKFKDYLISQARWQARRLVDVPEATEPDVVAGAIALSVLQVLQHGAAAKPLSAKDLQVFIDEFIATSGLEEVAQPMGGTIFRRKETAS